VPNSSIKSLCPKHLSLLGKQHFVSFALSESEAFNSALAPNETDDIWRVDNNDSEGIYHGHLFLIGFLK